VEGAKIQSRDCSIHKLGLGWKATEQKDGADRARRFSNGGVHALNQEDDGEPRLGGPRRRYGERNVLTRRMG